MQSDTFSLVGGIGAGLVALRHIIGIAPRFRTRWGKRGQGARMSLPSAIVVSAMMSFLAVSFLLSAIHQSLPARTAAVIVFPLGALFALCAVRDQFTRRTRSNQAMQRTAR